MFYADDFRRHPVAEGVREHGLMVCVDDTAYGGQDRIARGVDNLKAAIGAVRAIKGGLLPVVAPSSAVPIRLDEHYDSDAQFISLA